MFQKPNSNPPNNNPPRRIEPHQFTAPFSSSNSQMRASIVELSSAADLPPVDGTVVQSLMLQVAELVALNYRLNESLRDRVWDLDTAPFLLLLSALCKTDKDRKIVELLGQLPQFETWIGHATAADISLLIYAQQRSALYAQLRNCQYHVGEFEAMLRTSNSDEPYISQLMDTQREGRPRRRRRKKKNGEPAAAKPAEHSVPN
jgi:hypothetical protein